MLDAAKMLVAKGYNLFATGGTYRFLKENGISSTQVYWPSEEGKEPQALTMLHERKNRHGCEYSARSFRRRIGQWLQDPPCRYRLERSAHHEMPVWQVPLLKLSVPWV